MPKPIKVSIAKKEKPKRHVSWNIHNKINTLVISQNVEIKKQKYGCILNVKASVTEKTITEVKKKYCKNCKANYPIENREFCVNRVVPNCLRPSCKSTIKAKINSNKTKVIKKVKEQTKNVSNDLSNISSSPLQNDCILLSPKDNIYEDISSENFNDDSDNKIDVLIEKSEL
ncbi:uncharacterized protein LOC131851759 isoform X2 [Achroia grisella]|nr:uncharacterized protein LOC131851759 isoform X2 [Achroia grisella]